MITPEEYVRLCLQEGWPFDPDGYLREYRGKLSHKQVVFMNDITQSIHDAARVQPGEFEDTEEWTK